MNSFSKGRAAGVVLTVTIIEVVGLVAWLVLLRGSVNYLGIPIPALVLLAVLLVEHSIMQRAENPDFTGRVFAKIVGFSALEVVNWSVWLALLSLGAPLISMSTAIASAYFFVGFYIEHQITENVISQQPYLRFRNSKGTITTGVILETLSEGIGARLWILYSVTLGIGLFGVSGLLGVVLLVIGSTVEHSIQYVVGRIPVTAMITGQRSE